MNASTLAQLIVLRHRMCCGKQKYVHMNQAEHRLHKVYEQFGRDGRPMLVYYCEFCNHHHLGRKEPMSHRRHRRRVMALENLLCFPFDMPCELCGKANAEQMIKLTTSHIPDGQSVRVEGETK